MSQRELIVLGTSSQVPTRYRNHNGYLLKWDGEGVLFDPGEGTQRQMTLAMHPAIQVFDIEHVQIDERQVGHAIAPFRFHSCVGSPRRRAARWDLPVMFNLA